jgi:hypothetical protein
MAELVAYPLVELKVKRLKHHCANKYFSLQNSLSTSVSKSRSLSIQLMLRSACMLGQLKGFVSVERPKTLRHGTW